MTINVHQPEIERVNWPKVVKKKKKLIIPRSKQKHQEPVSELFKKTYLSLDHTITRKEVFLKLHVSLSNLNFRNRILLLKSQ